MEMKIRSGRMNVGVWIGLAGLIGMVAVLMVYWTTKAEAVGESARTFKIDVDFDKFRQILVRTDATASIVEHGGMKLLHESVESLGIDLSNDRHPIRNSLIGKSKAEVNAGKRLTVQLTDPQLEAHELFLFQDSQIHPDQIHVRTESTRPAGRLRSYATSLDAQRDGEATAITLTVNMSVDVQVSPLLIRIAKNRVQDAADNALEMQEAALRDLVSRFADKSIILPSIGR